MKTKKRVLSILLAVIMVASMLPMSAFAADTTKYWVSVTASPFDGSGGTVTGQGQYAPGDQVTISIAPNTDGGYCAAQWGLTDIGGGVISAINQKTSHTFTMPENAVQISITFTQHSYITYSDLKNGTHQNQCFYCEIPHGVPENHVDAHGGGDGTTPPDGYCDLCSAELHTHTYSTEWSSDEEGHWHECECGVTSDFEEHTSSGAATEDKAEVCTICGYEISPKLTHIHRYETLKYDADSHWYECSCGDKSNVTAHGGGAATCTEKAKCSVCNQSYGNLKNHTYSTEWSSDEEGHWHKCSCGATSDFAEHKSSDAATEDAAEVCTVCGYEISPKLTHTHSYGTLKYDADIHWYECSCGEKSDVTAHSGGTATCNEKAVCSVCNQSYGDLKNHTYSTEWSKDASGHWHECECGEKSAFASHKSSGAATEDKAEVCTVCGYEISPKLTHTHSYNTLKYDGNNHWYECSCGDKSNVTAHSGGTATCTGKAVCSVCNQSYGNLKNHTYSTEWSKDESGHWHECECGEKSAFTGHTSSGAASYGVPETCTVCGYEIAPAKTTCSLTVNYEIYASSGAIIGSGIESRTVEFAPGTVVDLSEYWPEQITSIGNDGATYYFRGFSYAADGGGNYYHAVTVSENTVIYATWVRQNTVTVEFDTNGGEMSYKKAIVGATYRMLNMNSIHMPVRSGYDFVGWSLENDGTADDGDIQLTEDCTLYAVWRTVEYFIDDNYDPVPNGLPVYIGGNSDAVRISDDIIGKIIDNGNEVVVRFPDGTSGTLTDSALVAVKDNLQDGESLQIAIKNAGSEVLPDSLTEKGAYGGSDVNIDKGFFVDAGITEERLMALGLINNSNDSSVSEEEFEYLYHYLTTDELTALKNELNESAHFEHHHNAVNWLTEMIERDGIQVDLNTGHLDESGIRSKLEAVGYTGDGLPLGLLRQADLDMKQLEYIKNLMQEYIEVFDDDKDELILAWANEAIAQKEFEATCVQMNALLEEARSTQGSYTGLNDVKAAVKNMTTYELKLFLKKANAAKNTESGTIPVLALGAIDSIIKVLNSELEARGTNDAPTYVQVGGTSDGINPLFIGAVDVNIGAVKVDGTTTPIAIKADRSDAVAWSTNVSSAALEEMLAMLGAATTEDVVSNIKAYKVLDNGTLEAKACKVIVNDDGTLTLSALSDGNSTYVFLYEPAKVSEEHTHTFVWKIDKEATETEDGIKHEECECGATQNENTVIPKTGTEQPTAPNTSDKTVLWIVLSVVALGVMIVMGKVIIKKRRTN